jgi:hypothetical protein
MVAGEADLHVNRLATGNGGILGRQPEGKNQSGDEEVACKLAEHERKTLRQLHAFRAEPPESAGGRS